MIDLDPINGVGSKNLGPVRESNEFNQGEVFQRSRNHHSPASIPCPTSSINTSSNVGSVFFKFKMREPLWTICWTTAPM